MSSAHYRTLEEMYKKAPINGLYEPTIEVSHKRAVITAEVGEQFHHGGRAVHGSVLFKMLDDAAYFAVNSMVKDYFVVTTQFNLHFVRPIVAGSIKSIGTVKFMSRTAFIAEATVYNEKEKELAFGTGTFTKSRLPLEKTGNS